MKIKYLFEVIKKKDKTQCVEEQIYYDRKICSDFKLWVKHTEATI